MEQKIISVTGLPADGSILGQNLQSLALILLKIDDVRE